MHYVAIVDGVERDIEITETAPDKYLVVMDGRRFEVDAGAISSSTLSILLNDHAYLAEIVEPQYTVVRGNAVAVEVLDLRRMRLRRVQESTATHDGPVTITSPMPGKVVAVLVQEGEEVEEGQGLVVVEAMKMENELKAPRAGVVRQLSAQQGVPVEAGKTLCVVE